MRWNADVIRSLITLTYHPLNIIIQSPSWLIPFCIAAGLAYAGALYFRDQFNRNYGSRLATLLGLLRFFSATILAFFILRLLIKSTDRIVEKPVILIAQDNSESLVMGKQSDYYRKEYPQRLAALRAAFSADFDVQTLRFGDRVKEGTDTLEFNQKMTDISGLLDEVYTRYSGRNLGALIIASDGLYNKGRNPLHQSRKLNVPVYTVALGDTTVYRDLRIADIAANRLAFLGNRFPVSVLVDAKKARGLNSTLTVSRGGRILFSESLTFPDEDEFRQINVVLEATETGLQRYTVSLSGINDELTLANNTRDFFIDVLDGRQQVLILCHSPHPDIAAIRDALSSNESYKVTVAMATEFKGKPSDYSLVIFHQLPSTAGGPDLIRSFLDKNIPALFVWGAQGDFRMFNELGVGFALDNYRMNSTDVGGQVAEGFSLFTISDKAKNSFRQYPPLTLPFGDVRLGAGYIPFVKQQVGRISTEKPLIAFNRYRDTRIGLIAGEGVWRWRLSAYQQHESHDAYNEWVVKTAQYLAAREDKSLFRVSGARDFPENMPVVFAAEVYNESYEPINDRDVRMVIRNENKEEFVYSFSPLGERYQLNAGLLPPGNYSYVATVTGSALPAEKGEFSITPLQVEAALTVADHRLMNQIAATTGGAMVLPETMESLAGLIAQSNRITSVSYESKQLTDLINYRWILALVLFLLSLEWLLRKRAGTY